MSSSDIETEIIRISIQDLFTANKEEYKHITPELKGFFSKISRNKNINNYSNQHNKLLHSGGNRKKILPQPLAFTDQKIIQDLKCIFAKVTETNRSKMLNKIKNIKYSDTCWDLVSEYIHQVSIDCVFLINTFVWIVDQLSKEYPVLLIKYKDLVFQQHETPKVFDSNKEALESCDDKHKRWVIDNYKVIVSMYNHNIYDDKYLFTTFLQPMLDNITPECTIGIEIYSAIWDQIEKKLDYEYTNDIISKLKVIGEDGTYPTRLRFIVLDIVEAFE